MITSFKGEYFFLSNFYPVDILYEGIVYPSSEHAYMAGKTDRMDITQHIASLKTASEAKRYGSYSANNFQLVYNWENKKDLHMYNVLLVKFSNQELKDKLEATGTDMLIEGNKHGDTYWGQSPLGNGKNMLGNILMRIRNENRMWE